MKIYSDKLVDTQKFEAMHEQQQAEIDQLKASVKQHKSALYELLGLELLSFALAIVGLK